MESQFPGIRKPGRTSLGSWQARGRKEGAEYEQPWVRGPRAHSPLLATDVMLLDCVAKEGRTGTSNDPGIPGIHVKGVCES